MKKKFKSRKVVRLTEEERMLLRRGGAQTTKKGKKGYKRLTKKITPDYEK